MTILVRELNESDLKDVLRLMKHFAAFERLSDYFEATEERLQAAMFGAGSFVRGLGAFDGDEMFGYALFYPNFASFRGQRGFILEDLYVDPAYRSSGAGRMLLAKVAEIARALGYERIDFQVLKWNTGAIGFYEHFGAVKDPEERHFKFTDDPFRAL